MDFKKILFKTSTIDVEKALPDAVIFCSKDGKIQWVNDKSAEIFETSKMNLLTSNISDFIENILNLIPNSTVSDSEIIIKLIGKEIYFSMTAKEIAEGYVLDFRDIVENTNSPQSKLTDIESSVNNDKNNFLLKLANDLKSPLQSIIGFSQAMSDGLGGKMSEQQDKYIKIIKKNSTDLMYLTEKLLELSATENNNVVDFRTFDIANLVNSVIKYNAQLYKDKDIHWNMSIEDGMKNIVVSDEKILKNTLQGILETILKSIEIGDICINISTPTEDVVNAKSLMNDNYIMISVISNSLLLSENDLESIFDPYKIVDTPNRKNLLRAIVLASVKNMVQTLNGIIWVESRILKNTTFNIVIPQSK